MNDELKAELAMIVRVHRFGLDNLLDPPNALATQFYADVNNARTTMLADGGTKEQATGAFRGAVSERRQVAADLRKKLREIAETAKSLDRTGVSPGLALQFRMPLQVMQDLRDRAEAFKDAVAPIKQLFIDRESPATIVEDLAAAIALFDDVTGRRYTGINKQIGATANLKATARKGVTAVRALDVILSKRYRDNPALLAEWKAAQRIANWPTPTPVEQAPGDGSGTPPASGS